MSTGQSNVSNLAERAVAALEREIPATGPAHAVLSLMMEATSPTTEAEFFRFLVEKIATALGVDWVFVTECLDEPVESVRMLASWYSGSAGPEVDFALSGTPCEEVVKGGKTCFYPRNISDIFPREKKHGQQSYIGVPIFERGGERVIGHIAIFDKKDMTDGILRDQFLVDTVLRIFSERASAEIQRMQLTRDLRKSAESYRLILDNQNEFVVELDQSARLLFVSPSYCRALGQPSDDLLGTLFPLPNSAYKPAAGGSDCEISSFEARVMTTDGWRWIAWNSKPVPTSGTQVDRQFVLVGRDVTEQKLAEEMVREQFQELAHVARRSSLTEMSTAIAHEVNQPLASILTYAQACLRIIQNDAANSEAISDSLRKIASNAERAGAIIRRLRGFATNSQPRRSELSVNRLVDEVSRLMQPEVSLHNIEIVLDFEQKLDNIHADLIQIQQVLVNLIQNAIDSLKDKPVDARTIFIRTGRFSKEMIVIDVIDHGMGVRPELATTLFDPFVTTKSDGLGIGLSISRSIVQAHSGELLFKPVQPHGAQFSLCLPIGTLEHL